jgi:hypothetical protein
MRHDPLFTLWAIECRTPEACRHLTGRLAGEVGQEATLTDEIRSSPGGVETVRRETHRLGDYFVAVRVLPSEAPASFRLLFHRRPDAGRFWRDYMVRILQGLRAEATATLEYRGDEEPAAIAARG